MQDIKPQFPNLAGHQRPRISIQLPCQNPPVPVDELHIAKVFQISHGLGGFQTQQTTSDSDGRLALVLGGKVDETFEILDRPVDEDALCIVAGRVGGEDGVGSCCENENVIGNDVAGGGLDGLGARVDLGDAGVEVVVEAALFDGAILFEWC